MSGRRYALGCAAILGLGVALRFMKLGEWSLWVDEGMTWWRASTGTLDDQGPLYSLAPLNFLVTREIILLAGPGAFWLRLFPAVCGCLGIAAVLWAGRLLADRTASLFAGLIVTVSPWHVDWSQNARHFAPAFLFAVVALGAYGAFWQSQRWRWLALAAGAGVLGLASHSSTTFALAAAGGFAASVILVPAWRRRELTQTRLLGSAAFLGGLAACYVPVVWAVSRYLAENKEAWNPPSNVAASIAYYATPTLLGVALLAGVSGVRRGRREYLLALHWLVWPSLLVVLAAHFTIASGAYALPSLAGAALLVGMLLSELVHASETPARLGGWLLALAILVPLGVDTGLYFTVQGGNRPPWKEAMAWLATQARTDDEIFATAGVVASYYAGDPSRVQWLDAWRPRESAGRQWILRLVQPATPSEAIGSAFERDCRLVRVFYRSTGPRRRDIEAYVCDASQASVEAGR